MAIALKAGNAAPDFALPNQDGTMNFLAVYRGRAARCGTAVLKALRESIDRSRISMYVGGRSARITSI